MAKKGKASSSRVICGQGPITGVVVTIGKDGESVVDDGSPMEFVDGGWRRRRISGESISQTFPRLGSK